MRARTFCVCVCVCVRVSDGATAAQGPKLFPPPVGNLLKVKEWFHSKLLRSRGGGHGDFIMWESKSAPAHSAECELTISILSADRDRVFHFEVMEVKKAEGAAALAPLAGAGAFPAPAPAKAGIFGAKAAAPAAAAPAAVAPIYTKSTYKFTAARDDNGVALGRVPKIAEGRSFGSRAQFVRHLQRNALIDILQKKTDIQGKPFIPAKNAITKDPEITPTDLLRELCAAVPACQGWITEDGLKTKGKYDWDDKERKYKWHATADIDEHLGKIQLRVQVLGGSDDQFKAIEQVC